MSTQTHRLDDVAAATVPDPEEPAQDASGWDLSTVIGLVVALACGIFVFIQLRPDLLFADTTPSGGDMGAHVWAPAFLRDHLLPAGRLSGWTPDWYAGFPAFHFYMVVPSLAIVGLNAGLPSLVVAVPVAALALGAAVAAGLRWGRTGWWVAAAALVAVLIVPVPYGIAFKLVSVSGLIGFPLAAWGMGRLARAPEPVPPFLAVASLFFLFDTNFSIYGGNIASTLAGEFAFSISLSLTLLALGVAVRGMDGGRGRVLAALIIALVALTHVIPVFFAVTALFVLIVLSPSTPRLWPPAFGVALILIPVALAEGTDFGVTALAVAAAVITLGAVVVAEPAVRSRFWWLAVTGPVAALLSAFWLLPFYLREPYFNDMGWERLDEVGPALLTVPMTVALPVAAVGFVLSMAQRERIGQLFAICGLVFAAAVANLPESALWNARLLPFYYLSVYLVAAVGAALVIRFAAIAISEDFDRPDQRVTAGAALVGLMAGLVAVGMPLRVLPFGQTQADGSYQWLAFTNQARSFIPSWTAWNYSGYERKDSYREYRSVVMSMTEVGDDVGCGRAMWEYSSDLDRYGTPMALMLLPHWTDGCIGSMEGLYFESSSTTPFHFLNQSVLSQAPSRAQRDLPYLGYDIERGVAQLQVMGVRYYMAQTDESIAAARLNPDLTEVAEAQPFVVFEVAGSQLVEALPYAPVVVSGRDELQAGPEANRFDIGWLSQAVDYYNDPAAFDALPAEDGPGEWPRQVDLPPDGEQALAPVTVSDVVADTSSISFRVDEVGAPVLVKTSFFPNWQASGADGPYRAGPNLMVVVPTANEVELTYGRTGVDWLGILVTAVGLAGLVGLGALDRTGGTLLARRRSLDPVADGELASVAGFDDGELSGWLAEEAVDADARPDEVTAAADDVPVPAPIRASEPALDTPAVDTLARDTLAADTLASDDLHLDDPAVLDAATATGVAPADLGVDADPGSDVGHDPDDELKPGPGGELDGGDDGEVEAEHGDGGEDDPMFVMFEPDTDDGGRREAGDPEPSGHPDPTR